MPKQFKIITWLRSRIIGFLPPGALLLLLHFLLLFIHKFLSSLCKLFSILIEIISWTLHVLIHFVPFWFIIVCASIIWWFLEVVPRIRPFCFVLELIHLSFKILFRRIKFLFSIKFIILPLQFFSFLIEREILKIFFYIWSFLLEVLSLILGCFFSLCFLSCLLKLYFWVFLTFPKSIVALSLGLIIQYLVSVRYILEFCESMLATTFVWVVKLRKPEKCILYLWLWGIFANL